MEVDTLNARYIPIGPRGKVTALRASSRYLNSLKSGLTLMEEINFINKQINYYEVLSLTD